jgi:DNA-binding GntR family transcriptional regulator
MLKGRKLEKNQSDTQKPAKGDGARLVYDTLRREILSLTLAPGSALDETALSNRFSMSRSPVREALVRLSADGLVEMLSNRSTLVSPVNLAEFPRYVEALDFLQRINTRLAAKHRTDADIALMLKEANAFVDACKKGDHLLMSGTNRDFHMAVAAGGKNTYLSAAYEQLLDEGRRILHMHFSYIQSSASDHLLAPEHFDIVDAIERRDVELADELAHSHSRQFHDRFMNFLRARYEDGFDFDKPIAIIGAADLSGQLV